MFTLDKIKPWAFLAVLILAGCAQDSIFSDIANEVEPVDPLIKGAPSKIVKSASLNRLYVASGELYEFDLAGGRWRESDTNGIDGQIRDIAATDTALYALSITGTALDFKVWKKTGGTGPWTRLGLGSNRDYPTVSTIFGAGNQLFAGASKGNDDGGNDYAILYETDGRLDLLEGTLNTSLLSGAGKIGSVYYLGTKGSGIFQWDGASAVVPAQTVPGPPIPADIAGFLQPDPGSIIAASINSYILRGTAAGFAVSGTSLGGTFTGALALAKAYAYTNNTAVPGTTDLLLIGIKGGNNSYSHGYVEVLYDKANGVVVGGTREPGEHDPSGIARNGTYGSTLKRYPVTAFYVLDYPGITLPNSVPIMFASTSGNGFYSYRNRNETWQWNHEE
ncbi:hypothetical protein AGMMS49942_22100 [Spirochaetia bacterium]|nr:hypothetical protein AGMMS49942_22100 [Spirochaetia bacterium]